MTHRPPTPADFVGKTIQNVNVCSLNTWSFWFTDGTEIAIDVVHAGHGLWGMALTTPEQAHPPAPPSGLDQTPYDATRVRKSWQLATPPAGLDQTPYDASLLLLDYTNWHGVRALRVVMPLSLHENVASKYHPEPQQVLRAYDIVKDGVRDFATRDIHSVKAFTGPTMEHLMGTLGSEEFEALRDEIVKVLETIAREGLPHPRDLDVALDAILSSAGEKVR